MGDELDFESFYSLEFQRVYKAILLSSGDGELAQDISQQAFQLAFARWRRLCTKTWAGGWVMTTALNLLRKQRGVRVPSTTTLEEIDPAAGATALGSDIEFLSCLQALPARQRAAVLLHYLGDLPIHEIASAMDVADGTVKALLSQARQKLKSTLVDNNERSC